MSFGLKSLSSYTSSNAYGMLSKSMDAVMPTSLATVVNRFGSTTVVYNNQYYAFIDSLNVRRSELSQIVENNLSQNPDYISSRQAGVKLAWQYEKADIEMGGNGSANWTTDEKKQILYSKTGTVSGTEGHHQKNVVNHPEQQANPDNIKFYKSKQEHLQEGHNGNFQNESDAPLIDKNQMLKNTNNRRVLLNEIKGVSVSAAIGFGVALTISAVVELASMGIEGVEVGDLVTHSLRIGIEGGTISSITYCTGRLISNYLQDHGVDLLTKVGSLVNFAVAGAVSIVLVSIIQFIKMKTNGVESTVAFKEVGKSALFSASILAASIIAQGVYGGYAGLIVSTSVGVIMLTTSVVKVNRQRKQDNRIREYVIEEYKPLS